MRGTIGITDGGWYEALRRQADLVEVNFWRPSAARTFKAEVGSPFLFKLRKADGNAICGYAFFVSYTRLEDWLAWECFGPANGCASLAELRARLQRIRQRIGFQGNSARIGCTILAEPVFFPRELWVAPPADWPVRTQTDKKVDLTTGEGARIWHECLERSAIRAHDADAARTPDPESRYGTPRLVTPRLGQGCFRVLVSEAYEWGCAMTGEHSRPALDAAHIRPYAQAGPHEVPNGLLLRADLHRLFDTGYVTVSEDRRIEVSRRLREDFDNGRSYYGLHGQTLHVPSHAALGPSPSHLAWHREAVYLG